MSGGFLLALDHELFDRSVAALISLGGTRAVEELGGRLVQHADAAGRLFTLFEEVPNGTEWEVREGPFIAAPGAKVPDMRTVVACPFECRWPDVAARLADIIARTSEAPTWVMDGDGVVWDAKAVDPHNVRL